MVTKSKSAPVEDPVPVVDKPKVQRVVITVEEYKAGRSRFVPDPDILDALRESFQFDGAPVGFSVESLGKDAKSAANVLRTHAYSLGYGVRISYPSPNVIAVRAVTKTVVNRKRKTTGE